MDIHPTSRLVILGQESVVGGVWSSGKILMPLEHVSKNHTARSYSGFRTESGLRMTGFSDVPLGLPDRAEQYHDTFESKYVTEYLESYVDTHIYSKHSLRDRIMFEYQVLRVEKMNQVWVIHGSQPPNTAPIICASKLVVAFGYNSIPHLPIFPNQSNSKAR